MKKLALFALVFAAAFAAPRAEAQFSLIPYVGYNTEAGVDVSGTGIGSTTGGFLVGFGGEFAAPFSAGNLALAIRPSIEFVFLPSEDIEGAGEFSQSHLQISGDVIAQFAPMSGFTPYAGAGLTYVTYSQDFPGAGAFGGFEYNDIGLNLLGGAEFGDLGFGAPFAQARYTLAAFDAFSIMGGVKINLGQK